MTLILIAGLTTSFLAVPHSKKSVYANMFSQSLELALLDYGWDDERISMDIEPYRGFKDDTVLVVLNRRASLQLNRYSNRSFPELDLIRVEHSSLACEDVVRYKLDYTQARNSSISLEDTLRSETFETFRQTLRLTLRNPGRENVLSAIRLLERRDDVKSASPNFMIPPPTEYISPHIEQRNVSPIPMSWGLERIEAHRAWNFAVGSPSITIGVIDSGIDAMHPSLRHLIHPDNSLHRDFFTSSPGNPLRDPRGHGTHVAGIIGARNGITGVNWDVRLVSLRVFPTSGSGSSVAVRNAIDHGRVNNFPILNFSGGGVGVCPYVEQALSRFEGLFIAAAGNEKRNNDDPRHRKYPASHRMPNVISVGASDQNDNRSIWQRTILWARGTGSNYGQTTVCVFAPGTAIPRAQTGGGYVNKNGTSMAAPFVAGTAALILSIRPDLDAATIRQIIMQTADRNDNLRNYCISGGRINAYSALRKALSIGDERWADNLPIHPGTYTMQVGNGIQMNLRDNNNSFTLKMHLSNGNYTEFHMEGLGNATRIFGSTPEQAINLTSATLFILPSLAGINIPGNPVIIGMGLFSIRITHVTIIVTQVSPQSTISGWLLSFEPCRIVWENLQIGTYRLEPEVSISMINLLLLRHRTDMRITLHTRYGPNLNLVVLGLGTDTQFTWQQSISRRADTTLVININEQGFSIGSRTLWRVNPGDVVESVTINVTRVGMATIQGKMI